MQLDRASTAATAATLPVPTVNIAAYEYRINVVLRVNNLLPFGARACMQTLRCLRLMRRELKIKVIEFCINFHSRETILRAIRHLMGFITINCWQRGL